MSSKFPIQYLRRHRAWRCAGVIAAGLFAAGILCAQQGQPQADSPAKKPHHHPRPAETQPQPPAEPAPAPQPETPRWPVNETPVKPSVTWNSQGLKIQANNASLHEILNEVSTDTGAKVEGMGTDERVFGEYGPGAARDVISQLLHGSNYNVLMIGDQGEGTPRQIVLSTRHAGNAPANANHPGEEQQDEDFVPEEPQAEDQPVQAPPPPIMNGGRAPMQMVPQGPPGAPRTPQQVLQELQQRQQQLQDQQQQQPQPQQQQH
jgi:hypothetical protein